MKAPLIHAIAGDSPLTETAMSNVLQSHNGASALTPEVVGTRSFGRLNFWWLPKVAPVLAVAYCSALVYRVQPWATARSILLIAFVGLCAGTYGYMVNDIFDIDVDRRAGKPNTMAAFTPAKRLLLCILALLLGFAPALFIPHSRTTLWLLGIEYLLPTLYAMPPVRLKGRGFMGLLCDACGAHLMPCLYVISLLAHERATSSDWRSPESEVFIGLVSAWALCLGLIGIVAHEFEDRQNDLLSGIRTFATATTFSKIRPFINIVYVGELLTFVALCFLLRHMAPMVGLFVLLFAGMLMLKIWSQWQHYRRFDKDGIAMEWWQLSHPYYEAYFPLAAAIGCAWSHPVLLAFPALQLIIAAPLFYAQLSELREGYSMLILGGRLNYERPSEARVQAVLLPTYARRIDITHGGAELWSIRAMHTGLTIRAGQQYLIKIKMRADTAREVMFGLWQDHAPWKSLGCCEKTLLSREWKTIWREFTAPEDEANGYMGLWLGGSPGAVEVRRWSVEEVKSSAHAATIGRAS